MIWRRVRRGGADGARRAGPGRWKIAAFVALAALALFLAYRELKGAPPLAPAALDALIE